MKGLSGSRSHHHGVTCDSACDSLSHHSDRKPYLLSPVEHHPADHPYYTQRNSFQAECVGPFSDPLASSTFPRRHYNSQQELKDECALVPRTLATKVNRITPNYSWTVMFTKALIGHYSGTLFGASMSS